MATDPRYDPEFQRDYVPSAPVVEVEREPTVRRNPWVVVLWVLAIGSTAGGLWGLWQSELALNSPNLENTVSYYVLPYVVQAVSPWLVGVGLATLAGVVFLHAVRWRA